MYNKAPDKAAVLWEGEGVEAGNRTSVQNGN